MSFIYHNAHFPHRLRRSERVLGGQATEPHLFTAQNPAKRRWWILRPWIAMHRSGWSPFWTRSQDLTCKRSGWGQWPHFKNRGDERVRKYFAWPWSAGGVSGCSPDQGEFWRVVTGWRFNKTYLVPLLILFWAFGFQVRRTAQGLKGIFPFARRPDSKIITRLFLCTVGVVPCSNKRYWSTGQKGTKRDKMGQKGTKRDTSKLAEVEEYAKRDRKGQKGTLLR